VAVVNRPEGELEKTEQTVFHRHIISSADIKVKNNEVQLLSALKKLGFYLIITYIGAGRLKKLLKKQEDLFKDLE